MVSGEGRKGTRRGRCVFGSAISYLSLVIGLIPALWLPGLMRLTNNPRNLGYLLRCRLSCSSMVCGWWSTPTTIARRMCMCWATVARRCSTCVALAARRSCGKAWVSRDANWHVLRWG